jgi:NADPH:quinone reductase-like Zn-dependent oxidoreductase
MAYAQLLVPQGRAASVHRAVDELAIAERGQLRQQRPIRCAADVRAVQTALAADGQLRVPISGRYSFDHAVAALADAQHLHSRGKLVIVMD